jgi:lactoylglutathione lyase
LKTKRTGIILCTEKYNECVRFYAEIIGLPVMHTLDNEHSKLTCLEFGDGQYLMIETDGNAVPAGKSIGQNPVVLRFNVEDVEAAAKELMGKGVPINIRKEPWGTVADFMDPDGNRCSLREEHSFVPH